MKPLHAVASTRDLTAFSFAVSYSIQECAALADAVDAQVSRIAEAHGDLDPVLRRRLDLLTTVLTELIAKIDGAYDRVATA